MKDKKIGLVLGSGASRGWAHIGAIEALEEAGIKISMIAGTSAGAFIGAAYAGGGLAAVKKFALDMDWKKVLAYLDIAFPRSGFIEGRKVAELIRQYARVSRFEDLKIPLRMVATDMETARQVVISSGDIVEGLKATMAVPGVVTPKQIDKRWLVDGGVVNPLPVDVCREMGADFVIAVDLNSERIVTSGTSARDENWEQRSRQMEKKRLEVISNWMDRYGIVGKAVRSKIDRWFSREEPSPHIFEVLGTSLNIMQKQIEELNLEVHPADILIKPRLGNMNFFDFDQADHAIAEGYRQGVSAIPRILDGLARL